jgi:Ser/Thr protein kinase RdoA (MazF antagonist)
VAVAIFYRMSVDPQIAPVLAAYPADLEPQFVEFLNGSGGFSGAQLWRLETARGPACLRRWPKEHPQPDRLEFIQAVLWHVDQEGFHLAPVPYETHQHAGYVRHDGHLWELTPWMPGAADYHCLPCPVKLQAAMTALAKFHLAAATFPLPDTHRQHSPGICERYERLRSLADGGAKQIAENIHTGDWPELVPRAHRLCELFQVVAPRLCQSVHAATLHEVELQPCIRDVWHDHVLFQGSEVSGLIDFGAMRPENVAADIARLLGSLVHDDLVGWHFGLCAYQKLKRLTEAEQLLVTAFDRTTVLMSGIQWLDWIYCQNRHFEDRAAVLSRVDEITTRLAFLAATMH